VDTQLSFTHPLFELSRRTIVQRGVSSDTVVKDFDVFKNTPSGLLPGLIFLEIDQLRFQRVEERFHQGIVITIARRAHTLNQTIPSQQVTKSITGILGSSIRVKYQTYLGPLFSKGLLECFHNNSLI
jgi:hypothetical protein